MSGYPRIHTIEGTVMLVNSHVIEGPDGLVIVDGQLTVTDAKAVRSFVDTLDKPVAGLVLTHGHPDHYAGAAVLLDGLDVPIIATAAVAAVIERDDAEKAEIVGPMMGDEWPTVRRFPDQIVEDGAEISLGGVTLRVHDVGSAESDADAIWTVGENVVFAGDLVYDGMHAYLADANHAEWLLAIDQLALELTEDAVLYVGHGGPVSASALVEQRTYVSTFVEAVRANLNESPERLAELVVAEMLQLQPSEDLLFLMQLSIEPVAASLVAGK